MHRDPEPRAMMAYVCSIIRDFFTVGFWWVCGLTQRLGAFEYLPMPTPPF
jgi:hypothetical protein